MTAPHRPGRARDIALGILVGLVVGFGVAVAVVRAAPRMEEGGPARSRTAAMPSEGALQSPDGLGQTESYAVAASPTPNPEPPALSGGVLAYAQRSFGPLYLAIPAGPGIRVRICVDHRCIERTSTDAGPALFLQRQGRIGDLSYVDFAYLCQCSPPSVGLLHGTIEDGGRPGPGATPPPTDVQP